MKKAIEVLQKALEKINEDYLKESEFTENVVKQYHSDVKEINAAIDLLKAQNSTRSTPHVLKDLFKNDKKSLNIRMQELLEVAKKAESKMTFEDKENLFGANTLARFTLAEYPSEKLVVVNEKYPALTMFMGNGDLILKMNKHFPLPPFTLDMISGNLLTLDKNRPDFLKEIKEILNS